MKTTTLAGSFAAVLLFAAPALAGEPGEKFAAMDTDGDAIVTQAEFTAYTTADGEHSEAEAIEAFATLAGDDGELTEAEFEAAMAVKASRDAWSAEQDDTDGEEPMDEASDDTPSEG